MEPYGIHEKSSMMTTLFRNLRRKLYLFVIVLTTSSCGIQPGVANCASVVPTSGILSYQGNFAQANGSGITGIAKTYISNGLIILVVENLAIPSGATLSLTLQTQMNNLFHQTTVRANDCGQSIATGKGLGGSDRFTQVTIRLNNSPSSTLQATALLNPVLPNSFTLTF